MIRDKKLFWKLLIYAGITTVVMFIFSLKGSENVIYHLDGTVATSREVKSSTLLTLFFSFPLFSFFLALVFSLIPYKGWLYSEKIIPTTLIILITLESLLILFKLLSFLF